MKTTCNNILVKLDNSKSNTVSKGGVIIPEFASKTSFGYVTATNSDNMDLMCETVGFNLMESKEVEIDGEVLYLVRKEDILVIL